MDKFVTVESLKNVGLVERLKISNFILETKMVELNQNKKLKQPDQLHAVWKLYFALEINECYI